MKTIVFSPLLCWPKKEEISVNTSFPFPPPSFPLPSLPFLLFIFFFFILAFNSYYPIPLLKLLFLSLLLPLSSLNLCFYFTAYDYETGGEGNIGTALLPRSSSSFILRSSMRQAKLLLKIQNIFILLNSS